MAKNQKSYTRNLNNRLLIYIIPEGIRIHNWSVNMA